MSLRGAKMMVGKYVEVIDYKKITHLYDTIFKITHAEDYYGVRVDLRRVHYGGNLSDWTESVRYDILRDKRRFRVLKTAEVVDHYLDNGGVLPPELRRYGWRPPQVTERKEIAFAA